jgi:hypothetical protein
MARSALRCARLSSRSSWLLEHLARALGQNLEVAAVLLALVSTRESYGSPTAE